MRVVLPDSSELELPDGATGLDAARAIGPKLAEQAVLIRQNGSVQDLRLPLEDGQPIQILTTRDTDDPDALFVLRHSAAHLLAEAEPYKVELVETAEGQISLYTQGEFTDLCRGPHLQDSKPIKAVKLTSLASPYLRGEERNTQLTRSYGTAFYSRGHLRRGPRAARGPEADELPRAYAPVRLAPPELPRLADPLRRELDPAPERARGNAARPPPGPSRHPGRRPHLLHGGAGRGGDRRLHRVRQGPVRDLRRHPTRGALDPAGEPSRDRGGMGPRRVDPAGGARAAWDRVRRQPRRGHLLRTEDRPAHERRARPHLADGDDPGRLPDAAPVRAHVHGSRQHRAHADGRPPRPARLSGAVHRHPHRALRGGLPLLARAGAGPADPRGRDPSRSRTGASRSARGGGLPGGRRRARRDPWQAGP